MGYRYALDLLDENGRLLEQAAVEPNWAFALEWTHFEGVRTGELPPVTRTGGGRVEPVWDARRGAPWVTGFRATVRTADGREASREIPKGYLRSIAHELSRELVRQERLPAGAPFRWVLSAFRAAASAPRAADEPFDVEEVARPLPIVEAPMAPLAARATLVPGSDETPTPMPVFVPRRVLAEAAALSRLAGDVETGGVLLGRLCRDGDSGVLFLDVTAQVPAPHTVATSTKLTFTAETWAAVHAAVALRGGREVLAGWWHLHLDWCRLRGCPPERRRECPATDPFLSGDDVHLHGSLFGSGYQVALLVSESTAAGLTPSLFGWFQGRVVPRGFHVLRDEREPATKGVDDATIFPAL